MARPKKQKHWMQTPEGKKKLAKAIAKRKAMKEKIAAERIREMKKIPLPVANTVAQANAAPAEAHQAFVPTPPSERQMQRLEVHSRNFNLDVYFNY